MSRRFAWLGAALAGGGLALLPLVGPGYHLALLTDIFFWVGMASCWNLACGNTGYIDFGSAAYAGLGAYAAGICLGSGASLILALALAALIPALAALAVGLPTLRLRGAYFAIATLALAEALKQICQQWEGLTGGAMGLTVAVPLGDSDYYYAYLAIAGLVLAICALARGGRLGLALRALRGDEAVAARIGVNTLAAKMTVYCLAATLIGLLGGVQATRISYFTPADAFNVHITIKMIIMSLLGGLGSLWGPALGAAALQTLEDYLGAEFLDFYLALVGAVIVAVIIFLPRGLVGGLGRGGRR